MTNERHRGNIGYLWAAGVGVAVAAIVGVPLLMARNRAGLFVFALGPVLSVIVYGASRANTLQPPSSDASKQRLILAAVAILIGPLLTATVTAICVFCFDAHPADRMPIIGDMTALAFIASAIIALALAASTRFK